MADNFTPLNIEKLKSGKNQINTILLAITTITLAVLAVLLFILIQKKLSSSSLPFPSPTPALTEKVSPSPTGVISSPTPSVEITPSSTNSASTCPQDEVVCPDGTRLKREGADCQFPSCPQPYQPAATESPTISP